jgi:hypothetical protein
MKKFLLFFCTCTSLLFAQLPSYSWHASAGGYFTDEARSIAVDAAGNSYVAGVFSGTVDFDPGADTTSIQANGGWDFYVLKLDPNGNLLWVKDFGSNSSIYDEEATDLVLDADNNIYITGSFRGQIDFDPGAAVYNMSAGGGLGYGSEELFILKLTSDGNFVWADCPGTEMYTRGTSITVDNGFVYTTGYFSDHIDLSMGAGTQVVSTVDQNDIFLLKMDTAGNVVWGKAIGGNDDQEARGIAVEAGDIFITGAFKDTVDFDPGAGTMILDGNVSFDADNAFVCKFNSGGNLTWAKQIGDNPYARVSGTNLTVDNVGNVYLTGNHFGAVDFDPGAGVQIDTSFKQSIYAIKLDNSGSLTWYKSLKAYTNESLNTGYAISLDASDNIFITGTFKDSIDLDPGAGLDKEICIGGSDIFMVKLDASGNYVWGERLGGNNSVYDADAGYDLKIVGTEIYFAGTFADVIDCDPGFGIINATSNGFSDLLVVKFGQNNTGLNEYQGTYVSLLLYPNPAQHSVFIQMEGLAAACEVQLQLMDITGKIVQQKQVQANGGSNQFTMDVTDLTPGIYMIRINVGGKWYTQRLIKS